MTDARTVHDALAGRAFLHDDPEAYLAGVDDAVAEAVERDRPPVAPTTPPAPPRT